MYRRLSTFCMTGPGVQSNGWECPAPSQGEGNKFFLTEGLMDALFMGNHIGYRQLAL